MDRLNLQFSFKSRTKRKCLWETSIERYPNYILFFPPMMPFSEITSENSIMGVEKSEKVGKCRKKSENVGKSRENVGKSRKTIEKRHIFRRFSDVPPPWWKFTTLAMQIYFLCIWWDIPALEMETPDEFLLFRWLFLQCMVSGNRLGGSIIKYGYKSPASQI